MAMSPRVSRSTVSRWSPGSGCGYGKKPWPLVLPSRPCATSRRSTVGGSKASPQSAWARSSCSTTVSSPASSARVNGPGRMPAPIIMPISMSFAEATPSSSTRQDSTRVLRPIRSTTQMRLDPPCALAVLIEPLPRLLAEVPRLHQLLHPLRDVEAVPVRVVQVLGRVKGDDEPGQVGQEERPHRDGALLLDYLVDLERVELLLLVHAPDLGGRRDEDPVDNEAGHLAAADRRLADRLGEVGGRLKRLVRGVVALDHLDQPHHRRGPEEVEAADLVGPERGLAHLGDGQRRGVRREDRVPWRDLVELGEHRLLDFHPLGHRLDDEVHLAEVVVVGRAGDAPEDLLALGVGVLLGDLLLLHEAPELRLGLLPGLLESGVHELLLDVLYDYHYAGRAHDLGDLPAHRARPHDGGFEDEHGGGP